MNKIQAVLVGIAIVVLIAGGIVIFTFEAYAIPECDWEVCKPLTCSTNQTNCVCYSASGEPDVTVCSSWCVIQQCEW